MSSQKFTVGSKLTGVNAQVNDMLNKAASDVAQRYHQKYAEAIHAKWKAITSVTENGGVFPANMGETISHSYPQPGITLNIYGFNVGDKVWFRDTHGIPRQGVILALDIRVTESGKTTMLTLDFGGFYSRVILRNADKCFTTKEELLATL